LCFSCKKAAGNTWKKAEMKRCGEDALFPLGALTGVCRSLGLFNLLVFLFLQAKVGLDLLFLLTINLKSHDY
jgi:hypothetical protein